MKYLITNSDDFGLTDSITDAIIETHLYGIMTSTTMMANMEGFEYAAKKAKEITTLGIGIHFNLTEGKPVSNPELIPFLLDMNGYFKNNKVQRKNFIYGFEKEEQIEIELTAQLEKLLDHGINPTHFDSHHHITGTPRGFNASMAVAEKFGIKKARITNIDYRYTDKIPFSKKLKHKITNLKTSLVHAKNKRDLRNQGFKTPDTKILPIRVWPIKEDPIEQFIQTLSVLEDGVTEISFHPGYENSYPDDTESTKKLRIRDFSVATSSRVRDAIKEMGIQLISYKDL